MKMEIANMTGKTKDQKKQYCPGWGGTGRNQGPNHKRRTLSGGQCDTFALYRPGSDVAVLAGWGEISIHPKTGVATITTLDGSKLVIGEALPNQNAS